MNADLVRDLFNYDADAGELTWRIKPARRIRIGDIAGCIHPSGCRKVNVTGRLYMAHRLIWLHVHGVWPQGEIDHINGERADNRVANLRDVTHSVNQQNRRSAQANNKTGLLGVTPQKNGRFGARIQLDGKHRWLGTFDSPEAAHDAYLDAKRQIHEGCSI